MSNTSFFQQYSGSENHITNNTLLMMRHLYRASPNQFEGFMREICQGEETEDDFVKIGVSFENQISMSKSVPDGMICQKEFALYIEAKPNGHLELDQINRHIQSIKDSKKETNYLIGLGQYDLTSDSLKKIRNTCSKITEGSEQKIFFNYLTYNDLIRFLDAYIDDYRFELKEVLNDFTAFLDSQNVLQKKFETVVFACGNSWKENISHQIYYQPASRPCKTNTPYIGIYRNKTITHIGKIRASICMKQNNNGIATFKDYRINPAYTGSASQEKRDKETVEDVMKVSFYSDLGTDKFERFYFIDEMHKIDMKKTSPYGVISIQHIYFDQLSSNVNDNTTYEELVEIAKTCEF